MNVKKISFCFIVSLTMVCNAQDVHLTQFYVSPQTINPAAFGIINNFEAGLQYKSQWNSFTRGFTTYSAFVNKQIPTKNKKGGFFAVGLNVTYDKAGDASFNSVVAGLPVNYTIRINTSNYLTSGLNFGYNQKTISSSNLSWGSQYDGFNYNQALPSENQIQQQKVAMDVGAGLAWVKKKSGKAFTKLNKPSNTFGISAAHLNRPSYSFYKNNDDKMKIRYNLYEYCHLYFDGSNLSLIPSIMIQRQGTANEVIFGNMFSYALSSQSYITGIRNANSINFGVYYRFLDALTINGMIEYKKYLVGVSYDLNLSSLKQSTNARGGLEIFFKIKNPFNYLYKGFSSW